MVRVCTCESICYFFVPLGSDDRKSYDYKVCYNNATRLWVDRTGISNLTSLRTYYGVRDS